MKLATQKNNTRDGELILVSRDLTRAVSVKDIAPTLQFALEHWADIAPTLTTRYEQLNQHKLNSFSFDPYQMSAPLPRAYQWADASAYVNHVELVRKSRGVEMPASFWTDPLMYQGGSDGFLSPRDSIPLKNPDWGLDFEAEVAVITDDVPMGVNPTQALNHIKLLMLVNDVSLRNLAPGELAKGFGFFQCKPASSFSPVAVTPDECECAWEDGKLNLALYSYLNGKLFGQPNAAIDMTFNFPTLIAHASKTRSLCAGTIIGSGTVSNRDKSKGSSCIVEKRMLETLASGAPKTTYLMPGDQVKIEMLNRDKQSIFGSIEQTVVGV